MNWYAPDGIVDNSGSALHAILWPRYLFIMGLSIPAIGLFLIAYVYYFKVRADYEQEYQIFAFDLGKLIATWGFIIAICTFYSMAIYEFICNFAYYASGGLVIDGCFGSNVAMDEKPSI
jgi:hypothetical protein